MRNGPARALVILLAVMLATAGVVGCADDTAKANAAIEAANARVGEFNKLDGEIAALMGEVEALGDSEADFTKGIELIDEATAKLEERGGAIEAGKAEYAKIGSMNVSDEIKTYATQQIEVWSLQVELDAMVGELMGKMKEVFSGRAAGTLDEAGANALSEDVKAISSEIDEKQAQIDEKSKASSDYFDENGLGG